MEVGTDYSGMGVVANQGHSDSNIILSTYSDESLQFTLSFVRRTLKVCGNHLGSHKHGRDWKWISE
jgi:hypothetical protein